MRAYIVFLRKFTGGGGAPGEREEYYTKPLPLKQKASPIHPLVLLRRSAVPFLKAQHGGKRYGWEIPTLKYESFLLWLFLTVSYRLSLRGTLPQAQRLRATRIFIQNGMRHI